MQKLIIRGGKPLRGDARISGAKNAALPILCAALLTSETLTLHNVPRLNDIDTMLKLLGQMGVDTSRDGDAKSPVTVFSNAPVSGTFNDRLGF